MERPTNMGSTTNGANQHIPQPLCYKPIYPPPRQQTLHQQPPHRPQQVSPLQHRQDEDVDAVEDVEGEDVEGHNSTKTNQYMDVRPQKQ